MTIVKENNSEARVIIPTYNRAHLIGKRIRSVLYPTCQDFERIVPDDDSTGNTKEIVKGFNDSRIHYICIIKAVRNQMEYMKFSEKN